jgi:rhodanese-related sulfurtransferase
VPGGQTLVVCKVGGRSAQAVGYLAQQGHDVVNLDGGMLDWHAAGRPMVSDSGHPPQVV